MPGNEKECDRHTKGLHRFYDQIIQAFQRHVNFDIVKCVLIASPGFVKDQFADYLFAQAVKQDDKNIIDNRSRFVLVHSSSGFKHSLKEVLADPAVATKLADTKAAGGKLWMIFTPCYRMIPTEHTME
ncbi:hypothetical protein Btru_057767 [Bulinus truncatus]|nr:hypothetical protein Btru_057767 [Bulinus truncatus]